MPTFTIRRITRVAERYTINADTIEEARRIFVFNRPAPSDEETTDVYDERVTVDDKDVTSAFYENDDTIIDAPAAPAPVAPLPAADETPKKSAEPSLGADALAVLRMIARMRRTGDVVEDDGEVYKHEHDPYDAMDTLDSLIASARKITGIDADTGEEG